MGVGGTGLRHLPQAPGAHGGQVDRSGHGAQGLIGADVGGGLLPADVLFPGLEGEHKTPVALGVGGLAHNPAGQLPHHGLFTGHKAQVGAAKGERHAQGLALSHGDVHAVLPRGFQQAQGDGVDPHNDLRPRPVGGGDNGVHILQHTEIVGALDIDRGGIPGQNRLQGGRVGGTAVHRQDGHRDIPALAIGLNHRQGLGVCGAGDHHAGALSLLAHEDGLRGGNRTVIDRGVGHLHPGEFTHLCLVFKD